jgi:uncharacterized protein (DUF302 family)
MTQPAGTGPYGGRDISGVIHRPSALSVPATVDALSQAIDDAGAKLFAVIDHSGEAERAGLSLRDTKLLIFGSPTVGTRIMQEAPLAALDLPLKVLVWADDTGAVWMSYLSAQWLAERHGIPADLAKPLSAVEVLTSRIATPS